MTLNEFIVKRMAELGLKRSDLVNKFDLDWSTLGKIAHGHSIRPVTQQKLALALDCDQGKIQACLAEQNPLRKTIVSKKSLAKQKPKKAEPMPEPEPEPEELPFDDLPEQEPEEGEDMKWFEDIPKAPETEAPKQVKIKIKPELEKMAKENPGMIESTIEKSVKEAMERIRPVNETNLACEDNINHPAHYTQGGIECIEAIKASMTTSEFRGYLKGNAMKYMWRYQLKNGVEDLRKAQWYLNRLIGEMAK